MVVILISFVFILSAQAADAPAQAETGSGFLGYANTILLTAITMLLGYGLKSISGVEKSHGALKEQIIIFRVLLMGPPETEGLGITGELQRMRQSFDDLREANGVISGAMGNCELDVQRHKEDIARINQRLDFSTVTK